jgi:hypothetical protein
MKALYFLIFIVAISFKLNAQNVHNLNDEESKSLLSHFSNQNLFFSYFYVNNFPCTTCANSYIFFSEQKNQANVYFKGTLIRGTISNPVFQIDKNKQLLIEYTWSNNTNVGLQNSTIRFALDINEINDFNWNYKIVFFNQNIEMSALGIKDANTIKKIKNTIEGTVGFINDKRAVDSILNLEKIKEYNKRRQLFIKDSLIKIEEEKKFKLKLEIEVQNKLIRDSLIKNLEIGSLFDDGIVIDFQNDKTQAILISNDEFYISKQELFAAIRELKKDGIDWHKWQIPTYGNMNYVAKLLRSNKNFKNIFLSTKKQSNDQIRDNFYWSNSMLLQLYGFGTFNILSSNDRSFDSVSYGQKGFLRYIKIVELK